MSELIFNIRGIFDASTRAGCLNQHGCRAYRIPPYQRGYKWGSETNQPVERLLSDLTKAWQGGAKEYLLQAITVKKVSAGESGQVLELIDGQQRLTTLFILLRTLHHRLQDPVDSNVAKGKLQYAIRHETASLDELVAAVIEAAGETDAEFETLKVEHEVAAEARQDDYYLKCAVLRCVHDLRSGPGCPVFTSEQELVAFRSFVLEKVKLMVNAVEAHVSGEVIFGNLNSNRVVLTETELIKGLLLTRVAREPAAARSRRYREVLELRIRLGRKWDELRQWADEPAVRSLYFRGATDGLSGLLELVAAQIPGPFKASEEEHPLFEYFLDQSHLEPVFHLLADTQARLQDWHADDPTYHLLGYCLMGRKAADRPRFLVECLKCGTRSGFIARLYRERGRILSDGGSGDPDVSQLRYEQKNQQIGRILLALSVFQGDRGGRFDFHAYEEQEWSLEHIFPQTPFGKGATLTEAQRKVALEVVIRNEGQLLSEKTVEEIKDRGIPGDKLERDEIEQLLKTEPLLHGIGNLCLLSPGDNAAMGCGMFNEKREVVRNRIARGSFVPRHTYEVFSKMIVGEKGSLDLWSKEDIHTHQTKIQERLNRLIKEGT